jgi:hypothetical protein
MMKTKLLKSGQPDHGAQGGALVVMPDSAHSGGYPIAHGVGKDLVVWFSGYGALRDSPKAQAVKINGVASADLAVHDQLGSPKRLFLAWKPSEATFNDELHNLADELTAVTGKVNIPEQKIQSIGLSNTTTPDDTFVEQSFNLELHDIAKAVDSGSFFEKSPAKEEESIQHALPMWPSTLKKVPYTFQ